jgi:hypothetical protein
MKDDVTATMSNSNRIPVGLRFGPATCHGGCDLKGTPGYSRKVGQILHVSVHGIPSGGIGSNFTFLRRALLATVFLLWCTCYPPPMQLRGVIVATVYSFIEYTFTYFSSGVSFTSLAQFWGNCLYAPILLEAYWNAIIGVGQAPSIVAAGL